jgi:hypothetical protein
MALDPEEVVTLIDHGTMTLRSAVARAMMLPAKERNQASIVRESEPLVLDFHLIRHLATRWDGSPYPLDDSEMAAGAFYLKRAGMLCIQQDPTVFSDSFNSTGPEPAATLPGDESWGGAPRFRQFSGWQIAGDVSCYAP